jgi:hypothetical protein
MENIIYKDITQGTDEWLELRHKCLITASEFKNIITEKTQKVSSDKTLASFAREKAILHLKTLQEINHIHTEEVNLPFYSNDMLRGNALEARARETYEAIYNTKVEIIGFVSSADGLFGYSPDGFVGSDGIIEIKCPRFAKHGAILLEDEIPLEYIAQIQGGLMLTGRQWVDFISYNEFLPLFCKRVYRNEEYIKTLQEALGSLLKYYQEDKVKIQSIMAKVENFDF